MKAKIIVYALLALILTTIHLAEAQQPAGKIPRIGFLTGGGNPFSFEAFRQGLQNLGYIEGKNIVIEYRSAEGDQERIAGLVTELVQLKVDVLIITSSPGVRAAKQATKTIPLVILTQADPVAAGPIDSLARPGGNLTGV